MLQTDTQEWITSQFGAAYDAQLNTLWHDLGGSGILIGDGANGAPDSTLAAASGEAGGCGSATAATAPPMRSARAVTAGPPDDR